MARDPGGSQQSTSQTGMLPVSRRLFRRERDLERYLNLWRLGLLGCFLLVVAVPPLLLGREATLEKAALPVLAGYFVVAVALHGVLSWYGWQAWMPAWVVGADLFFIVAVHVAFLVADQPLLATNSQLAFLGYFLVVALAWVRSNSQLARAVAVAAPISYLGVVFLAVTWRGVDTAPPDLWVGSFRWEVQGARVLVLAVVTHLVTLDVALGDADRTAARQDPLTGVFNRRYLEDDLRWQVKQSLRLGQPLAVLMLDLDNFKQFNDRHGHLAGDEVLAEVATSLVSRVRSTDVVARYGGDEFVVILPNAAGEDARRIARNLIEAGPRGVRCSVGICCLGERFQSAAELLRGADRALLRAKQSGGGVVVAGEWVSEARTGSDLSPLRS